MVEIRLRGSEAAQDIAQEAMIAVLEAVRAGKLREPEKLPAFVSGTARNLVNNHYRKEAKIRDLHASLPVEPAGNPGPSASVDDQRRALVRDSLERLKPLDQRILLLTLTEGMNPREIAPMVGLKAEAVRTRKARVVRRIIGEIKKVTRKR